MNGVVRYRRPGTGADAVVDVVDDDVVVDVCRAAVPARDPGLVALDAVVANVGPGPGIQKHTGSDRRGPY